MKEEGKIVEEVLNKARVEFGGFSDRSITASKYAFLVRETIFLTRKECEKDSKHLAYSDICCMLAEIGTKEGIEFDEKDYLDKDEVKMDGVQLQRKFAEDGIKELVEKVKKKIFEEIEKIFDKFEDDITKRDVRQSLKEVWITENRLTRDELLENLKKEKGERICATMT
jgi:hypothetical protein